MANFVVVFLNTLYTTVRWLFRHDGTTRGTSVEFWVVVTTLLLLGMFAVGSIGPRLFSLRSMNPGVQIMLLLNYTSLNYTLGLMEPSSESELGGTLSNFFQVWAVLIVTMQYSVIVGSPYKGKQLTLVDLLSSLWSASLLRRSNTPFHLRVPLWLIWSLNASRIVFYYFDSNRGNAANTVNMKLVGDYMASSQHTTPDAEADTMTGYRYLVLGEEEQKMEIRRSSFTVELNQTRPEELITVEKVWSLHDSGDTLLGEAADGGNRFKDVCLSFALYKLLRRRFFDFPMPEAKHPATRRLVSDAILEDTNGYERAFRVTEVELSFLHDFCYSKHAVVFAGGFPVKRLLLSLFMLVSLLYMAYAVRDIDDDATSPAVSKRGRPLARVTHGVTVTRCIIAIIVCREIWEVRIYVLSQWTKVLLICHYIKLQQQAGLRRRLTEVVARAMFWLVRRGQWDHKIHQHNLLLSARAQRRPRARLPGKVKLDVRVKTEVLASLKSLDPQRDSLGSYFQRAAGSGAGVNVSRIEHLFRELEGESHKVLAWHVATCLCQIDLLEQAGQQPTRSWMYRQPARPLVGVVRAPPPQYVTAVSLSNYCAYLVTQALVPDNGLVASKVLDAVHEEACDALRGCRTKAEMYDRLVVPARERVEQGRDSVSIVEIGAELSVRLASACELWELLGRFWAGYLLHLSASTRAAKHRIHLQGRGELTTHLWALLSHAGFLGDTTHGHQMH